MSNQKTGTAGTKQGREVFSTRAAFIFAAIGSAVGLGNIWRFPYVAYDSGGGAFLIPYLVALLTAGIPLLFLDYALGHRYRGSAPKVFRRIKPWAEPIGWIQVGVAFFITIYYAVIIAYAAMYAWKSIGKSWGDDPETHFFEDFLKMDGAALSSFDFVLPITITLIAVWAVVIGILALGVDKGIGRTSLFFIPLLAVLFIGVVIYALTLDGATMGLDAFFTPNWGALANTSVWIAAYGQIFFSLSIAFGIMLTYASYLKPRSNLTGSALVAGFANSSFEVLAGVGVFATLGFMAQQAGVGVDEVVTSGIGLAFVAFPAVISEMSPVIGPIFGVLFFLSLAIAGLTSLVSLVEVVISAVQDKLDMARVPAVLVVGGVMAVLSIALFPTTSGLSTLDIMDKFTNNIGIVGVAIIALIALGWILRRGDELGRHINAVSSFRVGPLWKFCSFVVTPIVLAVTLFNELKGLFAENYGGFSNTQINVFGWGVIALILVMSIVLTVAPWRGTHSLSGPPGSDFGVPVGPASRTSGHADGDPAPAAARSTSGSAQSPGTASPASPIDRDGKV
ncbi:sodium-dependent transporter [Corynebacterium sp. NPDC060344]|uniref:sodium-dependent transporter n=1 Tax=Corynebacterium sp. NPDC060344 TaxID=3347101 RepID=UPI003656DB54